MTPTKDINQGSVFKVFCWFPLINIKAVYLFDDISCKMNHDRFYMVLSLYLFVRPSFSLLSENNLRDDVSWTRSYYLDCTALTLHVSLLTPSIVSKTGVTKVFLTYCLFLLFLSLCLVTLWVGTQGKSSFCHVWWP